MATDSKPRRGSVFETALATTRQWARDDPGGHTTTLTCRGCGAPRQHDTEDMRCTYCGGSVLGPITP